MSTKKQLTLIRFCRTTTNEIGVAGFIIIPKSRGITPYPLIYPTTERQGLEIQAGTYPVIMSWSPKFKKPLPLISGVPAPQQTEADRKEWPDGVRTGIRIHLAERQKNVTGCVGLWYRENAFARDNNSEAKQQEALEIIKKLVATYETEIKIIEINLSQIPNATDWDGSENTNIDDFNAVLTRVLHYHPHNNPKKTLDEFFYLLLSRHAASAIHFRLPDDEYLAQRKALIGVASQLGVVERDLPPLLRYFTNHG